MGTIFKRHDVETENWYYEEKGIIPRKSLKTKDRRQAMVFKRQLDEKANRLRLGLDVLSTDNLKTVADLFTEFDKKVLTGKNEKYRKQLYAMLNKMVYKYGSKRLNQIKYKDVVEFKTELLSNFTRKTVHNHLSANKEMFQYAVNCDYIIKNPFDALKFPSKKPERPRVGLEKAIIHKAIDMTKTFDWLGYSKCPDLREKDEIYWSIMLYTGMRRNDAGNLTHQKVYGSLIQEKSTRLINKFYKILNGRIKIIGVGGVDSGKSAYEKFLAGADYIQLYTGMVFRGPNIVGMIKKELKELLLKDGVKNFTQIIGKR